MGAQAVKTPPPAAALSKMRYFSWVEPEWNCDRHKAASGLLKCFISVFCTLDTTSVG